MSIGLIISALELGAVYAVMAMGVYITYKILDFPDLSVDGTFPLGGAISVIAVRAGLNPLLACLLAFIAGGLAGLLTGIIHVKFKVRDLLSGIIMMTGLYSVNYLIAGSANLPITAQMTTVFSGGAVEKLFGTKIMTDAPLNFIYDYKMVIILVIFIIIIKALLDIFFKTKKGYILRAVGDNDVLVSSLAVNGGNVKILGLVIANALVGLSGSLYCQYARAFNLTDGTGKVVIALAAVIIGINIFGRIKFVKDTTAVIFGSVIYTLCVSIALKQFDPQVKNLVTAVFFLVVLVLGQSKLKKKGRRISRCSN